MHRWTNTSQTGGYKRMEVTLTRAKFLRKGDWSICKMARLEVYYRSAVVRKAEDGQSQTSGRFSGIMARPCTRAMRLCHLLGANRRSAVAQVTQHFNDGYKRNVSQWPLDNVESDFNVDVSDRTRPWSSGRRSSGPVSPVFLLHHMDNLWNWWP